MILKQKDLLHQIPLIVLLWPVLWPVSLFLFCWGLSFYLIVIDNRLAGFNGLQRL